MASRLCQGVAGWLWAGWLWQRAGFELSVLQFSLYSKVGILIVHVIELLEESVSESLCQAHRADLALHMHAHTHTWTPTHTRLSCDPGKVNLFHFRFSSLACHTEGTKRSWVFVLLGFGERFLGEASVLRSLAWEVPATATSLLAHHVPRSIDILDEIHNNKPQNVCWVKVVLNH